MHQSKKGSKWQFGMKDQIGADNEFGLVYKLTGTSTNQQGILQALVHAEQSVLIADYCYLGFVHL